MRGKTCRDCPRCQRISKRCATVIKVQRRCTLTHETVNPEMAVCVVYPVQMDWKRAYT